MSTFVLSSHFESAPHKTYAIIAANRSRSDTLCAMHWPDMCALIDACTNKVCSALDEIVASGHANLVSCRAVTVIATH